MVDCRDLRLRDLDAMRASDVLLEFDGLIVLRRSACTLSSSGEFLAESGAIPATGSDSQTPVLPAAVPEVDTETETSVDRLWNVIVWDDPINLMSYVTYVFQKVFGYSENIAVQLMMEVHQEGRSVVATVEREKAEMYVGRLHRYGLQATLEKQTG